MYISNCFAYEDVQTQIRPLQNSLVVRLIGNREIEVSLTFHPMQCKVLGEALLNAANQFPVHSLCELESEIAGSIEVEFVLENPEEQKEELACQPENLSAPTDNESLSKSA